MKVTFFEMRDVDLEAMTALIDYMYSGQLMITDLNVQSILATANLLILTNIKDACAQFIQSQLDASNCLGIYEFADYHSVFILKKHSSAFIDQYFRF
jgi:kelch-like protein 2/3